MALGMNTTERNWFVVDFPDDVVLFNGSKKECLKVLKTSYAGLNVVQTDDLSPRMRLQAEQQFI